IHTAVTSGNAQTVNLSTSGVPAGTTASFNPNSVTAGANSTLTLNVGANTAAGTYVVTVTGTGASATHTTTLSLTVTGNGGNCATGTFTSSNVPKSIPDNNATGVSSTLSVSGSGNVTAVSITVNISHTWRGDLTLDLRSPSGTSVRFFTPNPNDS